MGFFSSKSPQQKLRDAGGREATAKVISLERGRTTFKGQYDTNESTKLTFELLVEPPGAPAFEATVTTSADKIPVRDYQAGDTVSVLYAPDDHTQVLFEEIREVKLDKALIKDPAALEARLREIEADDDRRR